MFIAVIFMLLYRIILFTSTPCDLTLIGSNKKTNPTTRVCSVVWVYYRNLVQVQKNHSFQAVKKQYLHSFVTPS